MNSRTLFELIGTADEQMLEHSEWTVPKKRLYFKMKKAFILVAAVIAALVVTVTAAAVNGEQMSWGWFWMPSHKAAGITFLIRMSSKNSSRKANGLI